MKYLISGGTGYIGSNLVRTLIQNNNEVNIIIRSSSELTLIRDVISDCKLFEYNGTITSLINIFEKSSPDIVVHLAAYSSFEHNYKNIKEMINSNIMFGTQILEAMVLHSVPYFVNTGTYWQHFNGESYNPNSLYAATKQSFQDILKFYTESKHIKSITLKLFDTYGPNDVRKKIFTLIANAVSNNKSLSMTSGEQLIDIVYITDIVDAFLVAIDRITTRKTLNNNEVFFVSSGKHIKLKSLVEQYLNVNSQKIDIKWGKRPHRTREIMTPLKNAPILPNWKPKVELDEGLKLIFQI